MSFIESFDIAQKSTETSRWRFLYKCNTKMSFIESFDRSKLLALEETKETLLDFTNNIFKIL